MGGKNILVIFPYGNLAYSPTTLNLCRLLQARGHSVKVVYGFEEFWGEQSPVLKGVALENISYSRKLIRVVKHINRMLWQPVAAVFRRLSLFNPYNYLSLREILFSRIIKRSLRKNRYDELITVDILPAYWAQQAHGGYHIVSLEVDDGVHLIRFMETSKIKSVVIQSEERFERLFNGVEIKHFIVQNAPTYVEPYRRTQPSKKFVYNGTVWAPFGAVDMIEFVKKYPEYMIHFKGTIHNHLRGVVESQYKPLIDSGTLSFSETYLNEDELKKYLSDFSIGFCFYDFDHPLIAQRRFNYETAPAGKVFLYLSVGMPVVATRIDGFKFLEENKAGILVNDHKPETIKRAVDTILTEYKTFSDNALATGKKFSFDDAAKPFVDFISQ